MTMGDAGDEIRRCLDTPRGFRFVSGVSYMRRALGSVELGFLRDG